jgi:dTMP kinase
VTDERGRFIVLEGADGCGKSTQAARLAERLAARGRRALHVRDPGGTRLSEAVRRILLDPETGGLSVEAETFLYMAARAQLVAEVVRPALADGVVVICERWTLSTEVYQGLAGGFGAANVRRVARFASGGIEPDLVVVLDVAVGGGLARLARAKDRMESKGDEFHAQVVRGYRRLARGRADCVVVPAASADDVAARVLTEVLARAG